MLVVYHPTGVSFQALLRKFWEGHDPTQGMRQGNDTGTQYRSGIYCYTPEQKIAAEASRDAFQMELSKAGYPEITTEILDAPEYYYAEDYHQQYLAKNPGAIAALAVQDLVPRGRRCCSRITCLTRLDHRQFRFYQTEKHTCL